MIDNIKNFINPNDYIVTLYKNKVHIFNYVRINDINSTRIDLLLNDKSLKILGSDLKIVKLDNKELLITGNIKGIDTYEN